jgi:hypothetical protein
MSKCLEPGGCSCEKCRPPKAPSEMDAFVAKLDARIAELRKP